MAHSLRHLERKVKVNSIAQLEALWAYSESMESGENKGQALHSAITTAIRVTMHEFEKALYQDGVLTENSFIVDE